MYNRYVPQADGSYRRNRILEAAPAAESSAAPPVLMHPNARKTDNPAACSRCMHNPVSPGPVSRSCEARRPPDSVGGFLKHLLPKNFDTEDLIVVLLLLLMAGDCQEEQNTALLTLALYLFL